MNSRKKHSLLIVDDESLNIRSLKTILSPDYIIYASTDGQSALTAVNRFMPDVILLDILMPDMDGYEVIKALKDSEATRDIPVIFITGLDSTSAEERGLSLGAADYITKPFKSTIVRMRVMNQIHLVEHYKQQVLMTQIAHNFLSDAYADSLFSDTLQKLGEFMHIAQLLLYKVKSDANVMVCHNEWQNPKLNLKSLIGDQFELDENLNRLAGDLFTSKGVHRCVTSNEQNYVEFTRSYRNSLNDFITVPIFIKGKLNAVLDFSKEDDGWKWSDSEINLALLAADVFSNVFERDAMMRQFSIVENTHNLILSITRNGTVEYINPAVTGITGYDFNDFVEKGLGIIFPEDILKAIHEKYIPDVLSYNKPQFETEIIDTESNRHILSVSMFRTGDDSIGMLMRDITELKELRIENEKIFYDGLTGIYNRRYFDETINRIIKTLSRSASSLSLMMVDIDFFKNYNDTYGHSDGDNCLKRVAETLVKSVPRADDFVARYGGEEFIVVLPNTSERGAKKVAERLLDNIRDCKIPHENSAAADHITVSIGIITGKVEHTHTAEHFIKQADQMLYKAKQSGRNKYKFLKL